MRFSRIIASLYHGNRARRNRCGVVRANALTERLAVPVRSSRVVSAVDGKHSIELRWINILHEEIYDVVARRQDGADRHPVRDAPFGNERFRSV